QLSDHDHDVDDARGPPGRVPPDRGAAAARQEPRAPARGRQPLRADHPARRYVLRAAARVPAAVAAGRDRRRRLVRLDVRDRGPVHEHGRAAARPGGDAVRARADLGADRGAALPAPGRRRRAAMIQRVLLCGAWDEGDGYPRAAGLREGLRASGGGVRECRPAGPGRGKQRLAGSPWRWPAFWLRSWWRRRALRTALRRSLAEFAPDVVVVPYPGHHL